MIERMVREELFMQMEMLMKASGKMTKLTVMEHIIMLMGLAIQVSGLMISGMDMVLKNGQMAPFIMGTYILIKKS